MTLRDTQTEEREMRVLAQYLDLLGVDWLHVPNEGRHAPQYRPKMAQLGLKKGAPDVLVFTPPPKQAGALGAAIELKRAGNLGRLSVHQAIWLKRLERLGWAVNVCHGADAAIRQLTEWGYRMGAALDGVGAGE